MSTTRTTVPRIAGAAVLVLGVGLAAACGTEDSAPDRVDEPGTTSTVRHGESADAVERRTAAAERNARGSADAQERRMRENGAPCFISADAAERLGRIPCVD